MRPTEKKIQNLIQNLKENTRPELDAKILDSCFTELNTPKSSTPAQSPNIWRIIMKTKITKLTAAAIIIIAGFLSLTLFDKTVPQAYAIEQTLEAIQNLHSIHLLGRDWGNSEFEMWMELNPETGVPDYTQANYYNKGIIDITRPDKSYQYNVKANRLLINSGKLYHIGIAPAKIFEMLLRMAETENPDVKINMYHEFDAELNKNLIVVLFDHSDESRKIFIDPDTKLPVRILGLKGAKLGAVFKDIDHIEFNVDLPEGIFDFETTDDMKVVDMDTIMKLINDPQNGLIFEGLTEQEAAEQIAADFLNAAITQDTKTANQLAPAGTMNAFKNINEIVEIGKLYIQPGVGIGKVIPCKLRFTDGSVKQVKLIIRFRNIEGQSSCVIPGTNGGMITIEE